MRLLSLAQVETERRRQEASTVHRGAKIASLVDRETKKLNETKDKFGAFKEEQEKHHEEYMAEYNSKRLRLEADLEELERKCRSALAPIEIERARLEEEREKSTRLKDELAEKSKLYQADLKKVREREEKVTAEESEMSLAAATLTAAEKDYEVWLKSLRADENALQGRIKSHALQVAEEMKVLDKWSEDLDKEKTLYLTKSRALDEEKELLKKEKIRFESDRAALSAAFQEAQKKRII